jgi:tRNA uridine 5-carboxymethylaminomethyl modification enzyme
MGKTAAIITMNAQQLALMSCNPAIGGVGKSHLVKEIDALGGIMGLAADATGIQYRQLNLSRGPAVWSTRIQSDRQGYNRFVTETVHAEPNITVIEDEVTALLYNVEKVLGVVTAKSGKLLSSAVVAATGTFLGGVIHIGEKQIRSGRIGDKAATELSKSFAEIGFELGRLKTGTPPRLDGSTIDYDSCETQPGQEPAPFFSYRSKPRKIMQSHCFLTRTTIETRKIISANSFRSPIFSGQIKSTGPRYCPSIEDKYVRFPHNETHQIFLEPEGNGTNEIYPNGFSTALPEDVQLEGMRTVIGLEQVKFTRPGYAVEYDYCPTHQIRPSLETKRLKGLFFAGQINGTSGYEEAAAQGLIAGINAVLSIEHEPPLILPRSQAYIGVMIDDLVTRSTTEPYRMFTSRAEYRLALREDNARDRLADMGRKYGLIPETDYLAYNDLAQQTDIAISALSKTRVPIEQIDHLPVSYQKFENVSLADLLRQPKVTLADVRPFFDESSSFADLGEEPIERAAIRIRYQGYIEKQNREVERQAKQERETIPDSFGYRAVPGLRREAMEKFDRYRPISLGQAARIEGITPGDIAVISIYVKRHKLGASA